MGQDRLMVGMVVQVGSEWNTASLAPDPLTRPPAFKRSIATSLQFRETG